MAGGRAEQALIQAALARGLLTPAQLSAIQAERDALAAQGRPVELLQLLGQRTPPAHREALRQLWAQVVAADTNPTVAVGPPPQPVTVPPPTAGGTSHPTQRGTTLSGQLPGPGDLVGAYRVEAELARGGMGVVYRSVDPSLNRSVALKLVLGAASESAARRFQVEAQASAKLQHTNVAQVYAAGRDEQGRAYLAMEFVEGESLKAYLARHDRLAAEEAAGLTLALARALEHAHGRGVLHRDLKPENVLLSVDGVPKLTDFGLARELDAANRLTKTGEIMGTPAYMPPEQAAGEKSLVDERADVYGLGATLYHLLTGQPPFSGASVMNILKRVLRDAPTPPRKLAPDVPPALEAICLRCLEKEPGDRYPSMAELAAELEGVLAGRTGGRRGRARVAVGLALALGGLGAAAWALRPPLPSPPPSGTVAQVSSPPASRAGSPEPTSAKTAPPGEEVPLERRVLEGPGWLENEALELHDAWGIHTEEGGLRLSASGHSAPEVRLPLRYAGGPFELELEARLYALDAFKNTSTRFTLALERWVEGDAAESLVLETRAVETGPPNPIAFAQGGGTLVRLGWDSRWSMPEGGEVSGRAKNLSGWWTRGTPLRLCVRYDPEQRHLELEIRLGEGKPQTWSLALADPVPRGDYRLRLGLNLDKRLSAIWFSDVALRRLTLAGFAFGDAGAGFEARTGRICRDFVAGKVEEAGDGAHELRMAGVREEELNLLGELTYVEALALARAGQEEGQLKLLGLLTQADTPGAGWFKSRWRYDLCSHSPKELAALTGALARHESLEPEQALDQAVKLVNNKTPIPRKDWGRVLGLFLVAGQAESAQTHPLELGRAWLRTGRFEDALAVLAPLEERQPGATQGRAGYAAYRLRELDRAIQLWTPDEQLGRQINGYYASVLKALAFLAKARAAGPRRR